MNSEETAFREKLGIPPDAESIILFTESSHWDPDWLLTSEEYYRLRIRRILDRALDELRKEPKRVYTVECIFFLKMYWERNPDKREWIRTLVNQGRLALCGAGMTTPDTLLPHAEAILRDYLLGLEWLRKNGMNQEPSSAYLPDDFGHSPCLPSLLRALGMNACAFARIDGAYFPAAEYRARREFPLRGSSAEQLLMKDRVIDFVWKDQNGAEVLCHWSAFTYGQADNLDFIGVWKWMGLTFGVPARSQNHLFKRIAGYTRDLAPFSPTPYRLCPIGGDFINPVTGLCDLLDTYNRVHFPETGIFALNASLDDYFRLIGFHREDLKVIELDPNPTFMGFYFSRPELKQRCRRVTEKLLDFETMRAIDEIHSDPEPADSAEADEVIASAWETIAVSNHHDFITGTSPDRVWKKEQRPWLVVQEKLLDNLSKKSLAHPLIASKGTSPALPEWNCTGGLLKIRTDFYQMEFDERHGWCMTRWYDIARDVDLLSGFGCEFVRYADSGGLWRMGQEFLGGIFSEIGSSSRMPTSMSVTASDGTLLIEVTSKSDGRDIVGRVSLWNDRPYVHFKIRSLAKERSGLTCRFAFKTGWSILHMDVPGGIVRRPPVKIYHPTFWSAFSFAHVQNQTDGTGLALAFQTPGVFSANENGAVEIMTSRNAVREQAFGFLPLFAHPAKGVETEPQTIEFAIMPTTSGDWKTHRLDRFAHEALSTHPERGDLIEVEDSDLQISAIKKADRGAGLIVRIRSSSPDGRIARMKMKFRDDFKAVLCDARERDIEPLRVNGGDVFFPLKNSLTTIRIL